MDNHVGPGREEKGSNTPAIVLGVILTVLALTWAVATVFELALAKALGIVILLLFGVVVAVLSLGLA